MRLAFQVGGALPTDHPTYVERRADREAVRAARDGEYLHVIAARQVGKTSLFKRLAAKLGDLGWRWAYMDLATLKDFPKPAWYTELGKALARGLTPGHVPSLSNQIDLRCYLVDQALPWPGGQPHIALFLDEVEGAGKARDAAGKPFSDTFFSIFRALYNERDELNGTLIVALAGAVDPNDLVKDPDISPFNVGQGISLDDFTQAEARTLTDHLANLGLPVDEAIHQAIYTWTNGHPYLTQRVCSELERTAHSGGLTTFTPGIVGHIIEKVILDPTNPWQRDRNLKHVAKMLNRLPAPSAELWSRLMAGESVSCREASDDLLLELYLTGAVKAQAGRLVIRNQIYERALAGSGVESPTAVDPPPRRVAMSRPIRVFISSTWLDLQPERKAVEDALHRMQDTAFAGMEYFGSRPNIPREVSLVEVDRSDIHIGIFAHRYGSGITEAEYHRARERNVPCLIYLKDDSVPVVPAYVEQDPEKTALLKALKRELKQFHTVSFFRSPDHLATQVVADLHNLVKSTVSAQEPSPPGTKYQISITDSQGIVIGDQAQVVQRFDTQPPQHTAEKEVESPTVLWPPNIPADRYYPLPGRERELNQLLEVLGDPQGPSVIVVDGLGGLGKTAMAVELARRALEQNLFEGVVGDNAKQEILSGGEIIQVREATLDWDGLLDAIARQLGRWEIPTLKLEEKRVALAHLLRQHRYLILVDNLETTENADALVAHLQGFLDDGRAIVTSRKQVRHDFVCPLSLWGLTLEDTLFFLHTDAGQRRAQQILDAPEEKLAQVHNTTGGAPLALKLVVAQARHLDLDVVLRQLQQAKGNLYPFIFRQSWEQLSSVAQRVLIYIGRTVVTTVGWEELASVNIAEDEELIGAVDQLAAYSLLETSSVVGHTRYGIHQLTRQFVNTGLPEMWRQQGLL